MACRCAAYHRRIRSAESKQRHEFYKLIARAMGFEFESEGSPKDKAGFGDFSKNMIGMGMKAHMQVVSAEEIERRKQTDPNWSFEHDCWIWDVPVN